MNGGLDACRYGVLVRYLTNGGHGEAEKLTTWLAVMVAAFGKVSEARFIIGGELERENARVKMNPGKTKPKHGIGDTYSCIGSRQSSWVRRHR